MRPLGEVLYQDKNHFNLIGSNFVAEKMIKENPEFSLINTEY